MTGRIRPGFGWTQNATECPSNIVAALEDLEEQWRPPPQPQYIFLATDLDSSAARAAGSIRHLIERITGMPTFVGNEIHERQIQSAIIDKLRGAFLVLADITDDNLNTCIEAGMGVAAGTSRDSLLAENHAGRHLCPEICSYPRTRTRSN